MSDKYPGGFVTTGAPAGFSVAFNGSSDYLTWAGSTVGTNAFTFECWFYYTGTFASIAAFCGPGSAVTNSLNLYINNSTQLSFDQYGITATHFTVPTMVANQWYHVAFVRNASNVCTVFLNGVRSSTGTSTISTNFVSIASIGYVSSAVPRYFSGYLSNVRYTTSAVYDPTQTTINVPTQLFPIANTQLLTCQSPTIIDNSTNNYAITVVSGAKVSTFTPFAGYTGFNPALGAAAGGVWTLDEAAYYQSTRQWPIYDPYFNRTTLMLHGNGVNNAQNNTFLDSSSNNFTITRNGNTTQGTFTPFSQTGWSLYLPGSGTNYVQTPSNTTSALLGGSLTSLASLSFTIECFINTTGSSFVVGACDPAGGTADMILGVNSDGTLSFGATFGGYTTRNGTGAITFNQWNHVAWVVTGGYVYFYVNGAPAGSATVGNTSASYSQLVFGGYNNSFTTKEYLSNFRITKSAVYTGAFTPPTSKLTAITNTTLLTFQDNNYRDNSANNYTMVVVGSPYIQAFSPFVPAYITPTTYSNYFSGSAAYLSGASNAALVFGTGTYTVEMWVYQTARSGTQYVLGGGGGFQLAINSSGYIFGGVAGVGDFTAATVAVALSTWTHIVIVRNSTSAGGVAYYVNGVAAGTATDSNNYTTNVTLNIGTTNSNVGVSPITGCLSNLRVLKGTALYTAAFTPPTAPLTAITNTSLLTCQSSTIVDNSASPLTLTATGSTYPVTSPTPFPAKVDTTTLNSAYSTSLIGGSAYFDGTGDYLTAPNNTAFSLPADFTIECWWYPTDLSASSNIWCIGDSRSTYNGLLLYWSSGAGKPLVYSNGATTITSSISTPVNNWYHLAVVRSGSTITFYINGVSVGTATNSTSFTGVASNGFAVCAEYAGTFGAGKAQYISGLRVVKGTALYTSAFAPPLTPPTAVANTQLLLNYTNAGIIDSTGKNVFETVDAAQISTAQSKYGGSSISCVTSTSTGAYPVATLNNNLHAFYTGDFTVEAWIYLTTLSFDYSGAPAVINYGSGGANGPLGTATTWALMVLNTGTGLRFYRYDGTTETYYDFTSSAGTIPSSQWVHVAVSRSGTSMRGFVNGVPIGSTTSTSLSYSPTSINKLYLGIASGGGGANQYYRFPGYIDDARITKGVARYITNFTPPTSQLQDQ